MKKCMQLNFRRRLAGLMCVLLLAGSQTACQYLPRTDAAMEQNGPGVKVVAAGFLRGDGARLGPVMNGLRLRSVNAGEIILLFDGYRMPDDTLQYVVKVMPVNSSVRTSLMSVFFIEYLPEGIRLNVRRDNANLSVADLQLAQFLVEVSVIE